MIKDTTKTGFDFSFDPRALDDMLFVEVLATATDEAAPELDKLSAIANLSEMLIGSTQKKALYKHIAALNDGRVPVAALSAELADIMSAANNAEIKN